jgi:hypothetical protein
VVRRAELEAAQLRREIRARGEHEHGQTGPRRVQLTQYLEPVELGEEQVEDYEVPVLEQREPQPGATVLRRIHGVSLRIETAREKREDPCFVFDHQDPHLPDAAPARVAAIVAKMT